MSVSEGGAIGGLASGGPRESQSSAVDLYAYTYV